MADEHGWKRGPVPPETFGYGGVVPTSPETFGGFFFAEFQGTKVIAFDMSGNRQTLAPAQVLWYSNCLTRPPAYEG